VRFEAERPPNPRDSRLRHAGGGGHRPRRSVRVLSRAAFFQSLGDDQADLLIGDRLQPPAAHLKALQPRATNRDRYMVTVGRDTPSAAATCRFGVPSAHTPAQSTTATPAPAPSCASTVKGWPAVAVAGLLQRQNRRGPGPAGRRADCVRLARVFVVAGCWSPRPTAVRAMHAEQLRGPKATAYWAPGRTQTADAYGGDRAGGALVGCGFVGRCSGASGRRVDRCCRAAAALRQRGSQHHQRRGGHRRKPAMRPPTLPHRPPCRAAGWICVLSPLRTVGCRYTAYRVTASLGRAGRTSLGERAGFHGSDVVASEMRPPRSERDSL
jgi:hypothetical protein